MLRRVEWQVEWPDIYLALAGDRNDGEAWAALEGRVRSWARQSLSGRGSEAIEETVAATCASVATSFNLAFGPDTFSGFVSGYFRNARRRVLKAFRRLALPIDGLDLPNPPGPDDDGPTEQQLAALERCLERLQQERPRNHQAVALRYFAEMAAAEIAQELGVRENNARQIVHRGLERLRSCVQQRLQNRGDVETAVGGA